MRVLASGLPIAAGCIVVMVAGGIAYDNEAERWDIQTFALLVGSGTYFVTVLSGVRRATALELAFAGSSAAAVYASLAVPGNLVLLQLLGNAALLSLLALGFAKLRFSETGAKTSSGDSARYAATTTPPKPIGPSGGSAPTSGRPRFSWTTALLGGAIGVVVALLATRR